MTQTLEQPLPEQLSHEQFPVQTAHANRMFVAEVPFESLEQLIPAWQELSKRVADPNVFYEPWFLLAALKHLDHQQSGWHLLAVFQKEADSVAERLIGFLPFIETRGPLGMRQVSLWKHSYGFLTTPLIERHSEESVLDAVVLHFEETLGSVILHLPMIAGDGPFRTACSVRARQHLQTIYHKFQHSRAILKQSHDWQADLDATVSGHHKREFRRQRRRLEAMGDLEFRCMSDAKTAHLWVDWFVDLEGRGWKAKNGTAINQNKQILAFFQDVITIGASQGKVQMLGLFLNGEPIALKCNLISLPGSFAYKIAYDESMAKLSPGVQLEIENMKHFAAHPELEWMDSCAAPGHPMINRLWRERRPVDDLLISSGHWRHELIVGTMPALRSLNRIRKQMFK